MEYRQSLFRSLAQARNQGVEIMAWQVDISPQALALVDQLQFDWKNPINRCYATLTLAVQTVLA